MMQINISNLVVSLIRTYVTIGVGLGLTWLASTLHIVIDPSSQVGLVAAAVAAVSAVYYTLARLLEKRWAKFGVLLGLPAAPVYAQAAPVASTPTPVVGDGFAVTHPDGPIGAFTATAVPPAGPGPQVANPA